MQLKCSQAQKRSKLGPYDFHDAENADGIAESSHKNEFTV